MAALNSVASRKASCGVRISAGAGCIVPVAPAPTVAMDATVIVRTKRLRRGVRRQVRTAIVERSLLIYNLKYYY